MKIGNWLVIDEFEILMIIGGIIVISLAIIGTTAYNIVEVYSRCG